MKGLVADIISNSQELNKKRPVCDNSFEDVKSDKRSKGNKSNVINDECKDIVKCTQYLDDIPR